MTFVCKQTVVFVVPMNNIGQQQWCSNRLFAIFSLHTLPHTSVGLTRCIPSVFSVRKMLTRMTTMLRGVSLMNITQMGTLLLTRCFDIRQLCVHI